MCVRGYTRNHSGNLVAKHQPIKFIFQVCGNEEIKWKPIPSFGIPYPLALETSPKWNYIETFGKAKPNKWFALPLTTTLENGLLIPNKYPPGTVDLTPNTCEPGTPNPGATPPQPCGVKVRSLHDLWTHTDSDLTDGYTDTTELDDDKLDCKKVTYKLFKDETKLVEETSHEFIFIRDPKDWQVSMDYAPEIPINALKAPKTDPNALAKDLAVGWLGYPPHGKLEKGTKIDPR